MYRAVHTLSFADLYLVVYALTVDPTVAIWGDKNENQEWVILV